MEYILIYVSELAENQPSYLLENIYTVSNKNNLKTGVSGILLFDGKYFLQILEGEEKQVNSLMENKIKKDLRHKNIISIIFEPIHSRNFTNWSMRVNLVKSNTISDIYKNAQNSNQLSFSPVKTPILQLILILIKNAFSEKNEFLSSKDKFDYEILTTREREVL